MIGKVKLTKEELEDICSKEGFKQLPWGKCDKYSTLVAKCLFNKHGLPCRILKRGGHVFVLVNGQWIVDLVAWDHAKQYPKLKHSKYLSRGIVFDKHKHAEHFEYV